MKSDDKTTTKKPKRRANGEGTYWQEGNTWRGRIVLTDPRTGKPVPNKVSGKTRPECVDKIHAFKKSVELGQIPTKASKRTVEQYLLEWLRVHVKPNKRYSTYRGYEQHVRGFLIPAFRNMRLDHLSGIDVQRCLNNAGADGLSPSSVRGINATLKTALSTAKRWGYVNRNAAKDASPPPQIKFNPKKLTPEQGIKLLKIVSSHRFEGIFYLGLLQGMRRGEIAGLQWPEVQFAMSALHVKQALQRVTGEGALLMDVKSDASNRIIPLLPMVAQALWRRHARQQEERLAAGTRWKQDEQFVFTSEHGNRIMPEELHRELQVVLKLAGLPEIRFHDLRHACAMTLRALGVDLKTIQLILGHSSYQITATFYQNGTALDPEVVASMMKVNDLYERLFTTESGDSFPRTVPKTIPSGKGETIQ